MRRLLFLALILAFAFYGGWPAYSGYEIKSALEAKDAERLSAKVDFERVRESMRPAVTAKVDALLATTLSKAGSGTGALLDQLKTQASPKIVDAALAVLVKPETLIRIHAEGGRVKDSIDRIIVEQAGQVGGLGRFGDLFAGGGQPAGEAGGGSLGNLSKAAEKLGLDPNSLGGLFGKKNAETPPAEPAAAGSTKSAPKPMYGIDNIKRLGLNGPLSVALGVAKDPNAAEPDVTAEMSFVGSDWKLTGLVPKL